ncbi:MAG: CaiB/BaiF CoA-transferase family protein [Acidimicrobiales bacterium]
MGFLDGITVLDLASVGPAARASRWLSDFGASVIKIGPVPAQPGTQIEPPFYAYSAHRGMRRALIDLKRESGVAAFLRLAAGADVVIESFRPGVADRLGIGFDEVRAVRPAIVYCSTTGYGADGPRAAWAGHDLNYQAVSGYLDVTGRQDGGRPPIPGATLADGAGGGLHAVASILAALVGRRTGEGGGVHLDVSVADGMLALMALPIDEYLATGTAAEPGHALLTGRYACYGVYGTADGKWLTVAAIEPRFWANLCRILDLPQWADSQLDDAVQDRIRIELQAVLATRTRDEWVAHLGPADTCVAPVLSVPEVTADEQYAARGAFVTATVPGHGTFRQVGAVLAGMANPGAVVGGDMAPSATTAVLRDAGFEPALIDELEAAGAIG